MRTAGSITTTARRGTQIHTLANGDIRSHQVISEGAEPFKTPTPPVFGNGGKLFGSKIRHCLAEPITKPQQVSRALGICNECFLLDSLRYFFLFLIDVPLRMIQRLVGIQPAVSQQADGEKQTLWSKRRWFKEVLGLVITIVAGFLVWVFLGQ